MEFFHIIFPFSFYLEVPHKHKQNEIAWTIRCTFTLALKKSCENTLWQQQRCHSLNNVPLLQREGRAESTVTYQGISRSHQGWYLQQVLMQSCCQAWNPPINCTKFVGSLSWELWQLDATAQFSATTQGEAHPSRHLEHRCASKSLFGLWPRAQPHRFPHIWQNCASAIWTSAECTQMDTSLAKVSPAASTIKQLDAGSGICTAYSPFWIWTKLFLLRGLIDLLNYSCIGKQKHLCRMLGAVRSNDFTQSTTSQTDRIKNVESGFVLAEDKFCSVLFASRLSLYIRANSQLSVFCKRKPYIFHRGLTNSNQPEENS